jgi:hypothetical protein
MLMQRPELRVRPLASGAVGASLIFLLYLLFIDGGVFTVFLEDRKLSRAEFFEDAGLYFWRMLRLALYSTVPFGLLVAVNNEIADYVRRLSSDAPQERLGFFVNVGSKLVILLLALLVRLWFDLAQAQVVRDNERRVLGTLMQSLKLAFTLRLYAKYLGIGLLAAVMFVSGVGIWVYLPHSSVMASFVVLEFVTITQIASRLWLKAISARWVGLQTATISR